MPSMAASTLISPAELHRTGAGALLVALSGGLDSVVLLHALASMPEARARGLRAVHVHHGLHADADRWTAHCQHTCEALGIALRSARVSVARDGGEGIEAAARRARHAVFASELGDDEVLVIAHHRDDQAETFLLRALRASGPDGLGAMQAWRRYGHGWLWRPLLAQPRSALQAFAQAQQLQWIDDPSNDDTAFDRNFLRHRVLPLLRERWPQAEATLARSAQLCAADAALLAADDARALAKVSARDAHVLDAHALRLLAPARRARVLRAWVVQLGLPALPGHAIERIERELLHARSDAQAEFAWRDARIEAWRETLFADRLRPSLSPDWNVDWDGSAPLALPDGGRLQLLGARGFAVPLRVHARHGGERLHLGGRAHRHLLKHLLQEHAVPPWDRRHLPLLSDPGGELLAVADVIQAGSFERWLREHDAHLRWERPRHVV